MIFLGGQNWATKEYNVSLAVSENRQENVISWLFLWTPEETVSFLGSSRKLPSKRRINLAALMNRQKKKGFLGCLC
jgi:hypothetical protein